MVSTQNRWNWTIARWKRGLWWWEGCRRCRPGPRDRRLSDLGGDGGCLDAELAKVVKALAQRWFLRARRELGPGTSVVAAGVGDERDAGADDTGGDQTGAGRAAGVRGTWS